MMAMVDGIRAITRVGLAYVRIALEMVQRLKRLNANLRKCKISGRTKEGK
jgi:hypothetical protein